MPAGSWIFRALAPRPTAAPCETLQRRCRRHTTPALTPPAWPSYCLARCVNMTRPGSVVHAELVHCQQHAHTCARTCILLLSRLQDQDGRITHHCNSADQQLNESWLLQRWACFFGHYWWQRFPLPTFLGEFLYDSANLGDTISLSMRSSQSLQTSIPSAFDVAVLLQAPGRVLAASSVFHCYHETGIVCCCPMHACRHPDGCIFARLAGFDSASNPTDDAVFRQAMSDTFMGPANATELGMTGDGGSGDGSGGNSVVTLPSVALPGRRLHGLGNRLQAVAARLSAAALAAQVHSSSFPTCSALKACSAAGHGGTPIMAGRPSHILLCTTACQTSSCSQLLLIGRADTCELLHCR